MKLFELGMSYTDKTKSYNVLDIFWEKDRLERIKSLIEAGLASMGKGTAKPVQADADEAKEEKPKRKRRSRKKTEE